MKVDLGHLPQEWNRTGCRQLGIDSNGHYNKFKYEYMFNRDPVWINSVKYIFGLYLIITERIASVISPLGLRLLMSSSLMSNPEKTIDFVWPLLFGFDIFSVSLIPTY